MGQQVRVWFARTGAALSLSQPSLRRVIRQAFFRSRLPLCGKNAGQSTLQFGAPLAAGIESNTEYFDFELPQAFFDPDIVYWSLLEAMPAGVHVFAVTPVCHAAAEITALRYLICFRAGARGCAAAERALQQAGGLPGAVPKVPGGSVNVPVHYTWLFQNARSKKACLDLTIPRGHACGFDPRKLFVVLGQNKTTMTLLSVCRTQFLLPDGTIFE